jgi:LmbE family N-acetylglucosaminyl deacetylase
VSDPAPAALAIFAHPDDIEFLAAGTLCLLKQAGWDLHYWNLCSGNCGSDTEDAETTRRTRAAESRQAAELLGATWHPPICDDLELLYCTERLRQVAAVVRTVQPRILLTHAPQDYMEDHMQASRLAVTAAFARGMPNFVTVPPEAAARNDVSVYHALPHGLRDGMRRLVMAELYIDTTAVHEQKRQALALHKSQKAWLDVSQGMNSYLHAMDEAATTVAAQAGRFTYAEGWRRHQYLGFSAQDDDPLRAALSDYCWLNEKYLAELEMD